MILLIHMLKKKRKLSWQKNPKCWELIDQKQTEKHGRVWVFFVFCTWWYSWHLHSRREERNGLSVVSSPKYQRMKKKKQNESCTAEEARASQNQDLSLASQTWKQENFMVEMPSSGLKVSCVLLLQVHKKLISLHAHYFCNMHWWRGIIRILYSMFFFFCNFWNLGFHRVLCMSTGNRCCKQPRPGSVVTEEQLPGMICLFNYHFNHGCSAFVMAIDTVIKA